MGLSGGRAYFISHRIGRTYPGPPLEVVDLDQIKIKSKIKVKKEML